MKEEVDAEYKATVVTTDFGNLQKKIDFLRDSIDKQLRSFKARREHNRRNAIALRISISTLGVIVTVLLGLQVAGVQQYLSNIALILSGTITVLNSLDVFFNYRTLWIRYTITTNELHALKSNLDYLLVSGVGLVAEEKIDNLFQRYSTILEDTNEAWLETRREKPASQSL